MALMWVRSRPYDAVITDLRMPIVGGLAFIEEAAPFLQGLPVFVMTASDQKKDVIAARDLHVSEYLTKPVRPSDIVLRLARKLPSIPGLQPLTHFPPKVAYKSLGSQGAVINITGAAGDEFAKIFAEMVIDMRNHLGTELAAIEVSVAREFGYDSRSIILIEQAIDQLSRKLRVHAPSIRLAGDYWDDARETFGDAARKGILGGVKWP